MTVPTSTPPMLNVPKRPSEAAALSDPPSPKRPRSTPEDEDKKREQAQLAEARARTKGKENYHRSHGHTSALKNAGPFTRRSGRGWREMEADKRAARAAKDPNAMDIDPVPIPESLRLALEEFIAIIRAHAIKWRQIEAAPVPAIPGSALPVEASPPPVQGFAVPAVPAHALASASSSSTVPAPVPTTPARAPRSKAAAKHHKYRPWRTDDAPVKALPPPIRPRSIYPPMPRGRDIRLQHSRFQRPGPSPLRQRIFPDPDSLDNDEEDSPLPAPNHLPTFTALLALTTPNPRNLTLTTSLRITHAQGSRARANACMPSLRPQMLAWHALERLWGLAEGAPVRADEYQFCRRIQCDLEACGPPRWWYEVLARAYVPRGTPARTTAGGKGEEGGLRGTLVRAEEKSESGKGRFRYVREGEREWGLIPSRWREMHGRRMVLGGVEVTVCPDQKASMVWMLRAMELRMQKAVRKAKGSAA